MDKIAARELSLLSLFTLLNLHALSAAAANQNITDLSYLPRVYLLGDTGDALVGEADILQPLKQDQHANLFLYAEGRYGDTKNYLDNDSWSSNLGLGYREIFPKLGLIGGYLFADYNDTLIGKHVWTIGPGIERLGKYWEFRANGYIPVGTHEWQQEYWADQMGNYSYIRPTGHCRYDAKFVYHEEAATGADAEIGARLFKFDNIITKAYVNGYYFDMQHHDKVTGLGGRLTFQKTRAVKFNIEDSYDNYQHNRLVLEVEVSLYDMFGKNRNKPIDEDDLQPRLFDPIERDFAGLGNGTDTIVAGKPDSRNNNDRHDIINPPEPEYDYQYFFDANATSSGDGSAERPFSKAQYTPELINSLKDRPISAGLTSKSIQDSSDTDHQITLLFKPGNYDNGASITLTKTDLFEGKDANFQAPASISDRATFNGHLALLGSNDVEAVAFQKSAVASNLSDTDTAAAISIIGSNVNVNNVSIGDANNRVVDYPIGIDVAAGVNNVVLNNLAIYAHNAGTATGVDEIQATGVHIGNGSNVVIDNSVIAADAEDNSNYNGNGVAYGIRVDGQDDVLSIDGSKISGEGTATVSGVVDENNEVINSGNGYGILVGKNYLEDGASIHDNIIRIDSDFNGNPTGHSSNISGTGSLNLTADNIKIEASGNGYGFALGFNNSAQGIHTGDIIGNTDINNKTKNIIAIDATFSGNGALDGKASNASVSSGNGYGFMVGYNETNFGNNDSITIFNNNVSLNSTNNLQFSGQGNASTISTTNNINGNGYGLLFGYGYTADIKLKKLSFNNNLLVTDKNLNYSKISAIVEGVTGTAYGIAFGQNNYKQSPEKNSNANQNTLDVSNLDITVKTNNSNKIAYGIWANLFSDPSQGVSNFFDYHNELSLISSQTLGQNGDKIKYLNDIEFGW
jgi:hypothetical protein